MKTYKICKGQNKAISFIGCSEKILASSRKFGLCENCYRKWLIETTEGQIYIDKILLKNKVDFEKKQRANYRKMREDITDYRVKLQTKINQIVRLIDAGLPCLARKNYYPKQMHAGHVYARGGNKSMSYNLHNIHRQSAKSNHFQNEDGLLREGLVNEYSQEYMDFISDLRSIPPLKFTQQQYKDFYKHSCEIFNLLKSQNKNYNEPLQRIEMRNEINNTLGIYEEKYCFYKL